MDGLATVPTQESTPSETVTLPVGVPAPGVATVTEYCTVTVCPTALGSGLSLVIAVVVPAALTVCGTDVDVEAEWLAVPA